MRAPGHAWRNLLTNKDNIAQAGFAPSWFERRRYAMLATEHVPRQKAVAVIVPVEETSGLMTVHRGIGRVEVEHQLLGWARERGDELLHQLLMNRNRPLPLGPALESTQRRGARQGLVATTRGLNHRIAPQGVVIVQVFIAQREPVHPLVQHRHHLVTNLPALAELAEATHHPRGQTQLPVHLPQQQRPPVGGNRTAGKIRPHPTAPAA